MQFFRLLQIQLVFLLRFIPSPWPQDLNPSLQIHSTGELSSSSMARRNSILLDFMAALLCSASTEPEFSLSSNKTIDLCGGISISRPSSCPVNCFRADPVCGADSVTYWCGYRDAACSGVSVANVGYCKVGNSGSGSFPGQALLLVHIVWLIVLGFSVLFGLF